MIRTDVLNRIQSYLQTAYDGPITILTEEDDGDLTPPCAIARVTSSEDMGANQAYVWEMEVVVGCFHDADDDTIETAEQQAEDLFAELLDVQAVTTYLNAGNLLVSAWRPLSIEANRDDTKWQHFQTFYLIVAPRF